MPMGKRPPFVVLYKLSNKEVAARRLLFQTSKCVSISENKICDDKNTNPHKTSITKEEYTDSRVSSINDSHSNGAEKINVCILNLYYLLYHKFML